MIQLSMPLNFTNCPGILSFIGPHFEYCSPLLVGLGKVQCNRLEDANYYILRSLLGHAKSVPYEQLLTITDMSNLRQRRISQSLVLLHKCLYCNGPSIFVIFFNLEPQLTIYEVRVLLLS